MSGVSSTTYSSQIRLFEREIRRVDFVFTDEDGAAYDLTGATVGFKIGNKDAVIITYEIGDGLEFKDADPTLGVVVATIDLADPDPVAGTYQWEIRVTLDGEVKTFETGQVRIIGSQF